MAASKIKTVGFKTAVQKLMGEITDAVSIIYTVYGIDWIGVGIEFYDSFLSLFGFETGKNK